MRSLDVTVSGDGASVVPVSTNSSLDGRLSIDAGVRSAVGVVDDRFVAPPSAPRPIPVPNALLALATRLAALALAGRDRRARVA